MANLFINVNRTTAYLISSMILFFLISKKIFDNVYLTSTIVIDEEFHLPLGISYCRYHFSVWDPKVTTLPGLYLISTAVLGPLQLCTTYWLRFVSLVASVLNIALFYILFSKYEKSQWSNILSALTLALLPPLYFFSHLYYTDMVSLTLILIMLVLSEKELHFFAALFGLFAILCRQTNIIWVALIAGKYVLTELYLGTMHKSIPADKGINIEKFPIFMKHLLNNPLKALRSMHLQFWLDVSCYLAILITFFIFVYFNGSIVVGDKHAHEVTWHFPQLFYFGLFCLLFAWPYFFGEVLSFLSFAKRHKLLILAALLIVTVIIHFNTLVHPYILADNRHYMFYVWNRFYGRYLAFRYLMAPVYVFAWYVIIKVLYDKEDMSFLFLFLPCVAFVLTTQKLIDVRYYFIPYILFRLRVKNNTTTVFNLILEFVTFLVINTISLKLFFTKSIHWSDYPQPQRLMW